MFDIRVDERIDKISINTARRDLEDAINRRYKIVKDELSETISNNSTQPHT